MSARTGNISVRNTQDYVVNPAHPCGALADGIKHRLHVSRRAADDTEHLGGRGLVLQRLAQRSVALLELVEQPHVLDGDHRLVRERFQELDLPLTEWTDVQASEYDLPDISALVSKRCN